MRKAGWMAGCMVMLAACTAKTEAPMAAPDPAAEQQSVREFIDHVAATFNAGSLDEFMDVFTDDAVQFNAGEPDIVGKEAIRQMYQGALAVNDIKVQFNTTEISVAGDLAYEAGTYTIHVAPKAAGAQPMDITNRHVHVLRRQPDGSWKTWRMMTNAASAAPTTP